VPGGDRLFEGFDLEDAAGVPRKEDLHRGGALGGVARIECRHVGVVLCGIRETVPRLGGNVGGREGEHQREDETEPTHHRHYNLLSLPEIQ
jgi:hypothetical protein